MSSNEVIPAREIEVRWSGPYQWPGVVGDSNLPRIEEAPEASLGGVYLWTVEYGGKYLIYAAGKTRRSFVKRLREHSTAHRSGFFTIFDMDAMKQGRRQEIWHGFFTKRRPAERQAEFRRRKGEILEAVARQLEAFRVFVAPLEPEPRLLSRMESSIMDCLYSAPEPFSVIPDHGMSLSRRWSSERVIVVRNIGAEVFHVLPEVMEI